jgi:two-component system response regulator YesN
MYDVMIIDDDKPIRDYLRSIINWNDLHLQLVCEAEDSEGARELYLLHRPKIIITDINIPIISGIELAKEISLINPEVRFIIITGYNDFEYARSSVQLGAVDLISKPIIPEEIENSLKKAIVFFDNLYQQQTAYQTLNQLVVEYLPTLQEKFIEHMLHGCAYYSKQEIKAKLTSLQFDIENTNYAAVLVSPSMVSIPFQEVELILMALKNIGDELISTAGFKLFSFFGMDYCLNYLVSWSSDFGYNRLEDTLNKLYEKMDLFFNVKIFAGIGRPVQELPRISISFDEALIALNCQDVLGSETIVNYKNISQFDSQYTTDLEQVVNSLTILFRQNNNKILNEKLNQFFNRHSGQDDTDIYAAREFALKYLSNIITLSFSLGIEVKTVSGNMDVFMYVLSADSIFSLKQYTIEMTNTLLGALFQKRAERKNQIIKLAKGYIKENLSNDSLNLDLVSNHVELSSNYFCKLFREEEGISFSNYLNIQRIKLAKKMLKESNLKVYEISYKIGYSNPKYFSYVFKRITGLSPLEYKNNPPQII